MRAKFFDALVPTTWDELKPDQFVRIVRALRTSRSKAECQVRIAHAVLGLGRWTVARNAALQFALSAEERHCLAVRLSRPFMEEAGEISETLLPEMGLHPLRSRLRRLLVPLSRGGQFKVVGVCTKDLLNNVDAKTWGMADTLFLKYNRAVGPLRPSGTSPADRGGSDKAMDWLRAMAAVLYAPEGMSREDRLNGVHLKLCDRLKDDELHALHFNWSCMRKVYMREAPAVFGNGQKKVVRKLRGWNDVLRDLSGGKFGAMPETGMTPVRDFLKELHERIVEQKQRKEQQEQHAERMRRMRLHH